MISIYWLPYFFMRRLLQIWFFIDIWMKKNNSISINIRICNILNFAEINLSTDCIDYSRYFYLPSFVILSDADSQAYFSKTCVILLGIAWGVDGSINRSSSTLKISHFSSISKYTEVGVGLPDSCSVTFAMSVKAVRALW